jgi:hypothetical protein
MTEKNLNILADKIAKKVLEELLKKQKELDDKMLEDINDLNSAIHYKYVYSDTDDSQSTSIEDQIITLREKRAKACELEDYMLAAKINEDILKLKEKLK